MILDTNNKFHFIGIGGISMSALAIYLKNQGYIVQGSDKTKSEITDTLQKHGIKVYIGHKKRNISNCNIIVYNHAINKDNVELKHASSSSLTCINRAELLGEISKKYKNVIAVAGTHGKTTTVALLAHIFSCAKLHPTVHAGGIMQNYQTNMLMGNNTFFITEACEYKNSFLTLSPNLTVITNVEAEHLDYFKNYDNLKISYEKLAKQSQIVVCEKEFNANYVSFGENGTYTAKKIKQNKRGLFFTAYKNNKKIDKFHLTCIGKHNVKNALACLAVCDTYKIKTKDIKKAFTTFIGIERRCEVIRKKPLIILDYAHHPSQIKVMIETFKEIYKNRKIKVLFQPHTYSRTESFFENFVENLSQSYQTAILKSYSAREKYNYNGSAKKIYTTLKHIKSNTLYFKTIEECLKYVNQISKKDILLIMGAGDIEQITKKIKH